MQAVATVPLALVRQDDTTLRERMAAFHAIMSTRRSVRTFAPDPVPQEVIERAIQIAGTAPSGAHQQPWHFVAISDPHIKQRIREAAEEEERAFYAGRAGEEWLDALKPLGTDWQKPFLATAPWLIAIFAERWGEAPQADGSTHRRKHYYVPESVGIATGFLIAALHQAGLATLTHTPAPMGFLSAICGRPEREKPMILLVVGHPAEGCRVPDIRRKPFEAIATVL